MTSYGGELLLDSSSRWSGISSLSLPSPFRYHSFSKKQRNPLMKKILGLQAPMELTSFCQLEASEPVDMQRLTSSSAPFPEMSASSGRDCKIVLFAIHQTQEFGSMQWLTSSSAPLSSRDDKSDDMRRYLMVIHTFFSARGKRACWHAETNIIICTFLGDVNVFRPRLWKSLICYPSDSMV